MGATLLRESLVRHQAERLAALAGGDVGAFTESTTALLPALGLDAGVALTIGAGWGLRLRLGPVVHRRIDGGGDLGWAGAVEVERLP